MNPFVFNENLCNILVYHKLCSRRSARSFIQKHKICINGNPLPSEQVFVDAESDRITVDSVELPPIHHLYIVLNKPQGYVCSTVSDRHPVVYNLLGDLNPADLKLHTVGRLDSDTTGLLFLTTNGAFSNFICDPENSIPKTYEVKLKNPVNLNLQKEYCLKALKGLVLPADKKVPSQTALPARIHWPENLQNKTLTECRITVTSGVFHEVKRIFRSLGNEVCALKRISIGKYFLEDELPEGNYRVLDRESLDIFD